MTTIDASSVFPRARRVAYWLATAFVALNAAAAGAMDVLRLPPFFGVLVHLGYPPYFSAILGTWKLLGALALLVPRYPRVKEWAYAGMFIDYTAAIASYVAIGEGTLPNLVGPIVSITFLAASWWLRPSSRRLDA